MECPTNYDSVQYFKILYQEEIYKKLYIYIKLSLANEFRKSLPPFSLIRDFGKQNTRGNVSKISVSLTCY